TYNGDEEYITIPKGLVEKLRTLSQQEGGTLYMLLLAAYNILLYKYSKQEDIIVGTPIANRNHLEIEPLIGFFVNTLALRTRVRKDM
ncbi:condensation domain-containing protein, partial [Bacillus toyonensis]